MTATSIRPAGVFTLTSRGLERLDTTPLPLGQVVSYEDMANPRQEAVVVEATASSPYGQRCIFLDTLQQTTVSQGDIDGPGGWRLVDRVLPCTEARQYMFRAQDAQRERQAEAERQRQEAEARQTIGRNILAQRPSGTVAAIVAELEQDQSDIMTDYFHVGTVRGKVLAWSKTTRNNFGEMRKAAALDPDTRHLAVGGPDCEQREDYAGGHGYYLKAGGHYASGWAVRKLPVAGYESRIAEYLATGTTL